MVRKYKILEIKKKFYKKKTDFVQDLLPVLLKNNTKIYGYKSKEYIIDCGTPKRLKKAEINYKLNF
jgi:NDP-sugar pyrophosphorylase family protein